VDTDASGERLVFPIGHYVGAQYRGAGPDDGVQQVRRGASFHDLSAAQFLVWTLAHGSPEAVENEVPWGRRAIQELAGLSGVRESGTHVDELLARGLLVEVGPDTELDFAKAYRAVPTMLGLGNTAEDPWSFGIGLLNQPVVQVSHAVYDLWQWSTMDDTLWATCEGAADAARRANNTEPDYIDPGRLLSGLLGALPALLLTNAMYLDIEFRLRHPA
jgi:hypothetical protein